MNKRWLRVGLLASGTFTINVFVRLISEFGDITGQSTLDLIAYLGLGAVLVILVVAGAWWAVRYPFTRLFFDLGAAVVAFALLATLIGPLLVGNSPSASGLAYVVGQILLFIGVGLGAVLLGFASMVTLGKDWKSRGLKRYEESYHNRRPHRPARR